MAKGANGTAKGAAPVEVVDWSANKQLVRANAEGGQSFDELVEELRNWREMKKNAEDEGKKVDLRISELLKQAGVKSVLVGGLSVTRAEGRSPSHIDGQRLLTKGVDPKIIKFATVKGTPYVYTNLGKPKEDNGGR